MSDLPENDVLPADRAAPSERDPKVSPARLCFGVLAPAWAWAVQELGSTSLATDLCTAGKPHLARTVLVALFAATALLSVSGGVVGYRSWKMLHGAGSASSVQEGRELVALFGLLLGIVLSLGIVWSGIPTFVVDVCEARR